MEYFIDEQRFGPYSFWHHEHHFKEVDRRRNDRHCSLQRGAFLVFGRHCQFLICKISIEKNI